MIIIGGVAVAVIIHRGLDLAALVGVIHIQTHIDIAEQLEVHLARCIDKIIIQR